MDERSPEMLKPTLISGVLFGTVGAVPILNSINCACCALVVACGFFASYLYSRECRRQGAGFRPGTGATVGLVAGAFYALTTTLLTGLILAFFPPDWGQAFEQARQMPWSRPEVIESMQNLLRSTSPFVLLVLLLFFWVLVGAVFSTVGGLIGGAAFKVVPQSPAPPAIEGDLGPPPPPSAPAV